MKPILYHGTSNPNLIALEARSRTEDMDNSALVFATSSKQCAFLYTLQETGNPQRPRAILHDGDVHPSILVTPSQPHYFGDSIDGRVFVVPNDSFTPSGKSSDEWISKETVPLNTAMAITVSNTNQALQEGVQLFLVTGGLEAWPPVFEDIKQLQGRDQWLAYLKKGVEDGTITHKNKERGLSPINLANGQMETQVSIVSSETMILPTPIVNATPKTLHNL